MITTLNERMRGLASLFWREVAKFGAVGGIAFIIDNGLTFYLMHGPMTDSEAKARFFGASVATVFSWIANRFWTFRHRRQANVLREFVMFVIINGIGIGISTGLTALAKYGMGVTDKNMLFLAGVVGILVATVVRFFAYRFLVFNQELDEEPEFSHDHEIIERHPHTQPGSLVSESAAREAVNDPELPGPTARCSSSPASLRPSEPSSCTARRRPVVAQTLEISSIATSTISAPVPVPPYSSSKGRPKMSYSRNSSTMSHGNSAVLSISSARGATRSRASVRTMSRISRCSSVSGS